MLTDQDRLVLANMELNAEMPLTEFAKLLGLSTSTTRYTIDKLLERNLARYYPWIDPYPLGYRLINIFFSVNQGPEAQTAKLLQMIVKHPQVTWLRELGGSYQYCISFVTQKIHDLMTFLEDLATSCPNTIRAKSIMDQLALVLFPPKFLTSKIVGRTSCPRGLNVKLCRGDELDHRILGALISGSHSRRDIARSLGVAPSTIDARIQKLREHGVFKGFVYLRRLDLIGTSEYKLNITVMNRTRKLRDALLAFSEKHPHVIFWVEMIGEWDYEIDIEVSDAAGASRVCDALREQFGREIAAIEIVPMFRELKDACFPTLVREQAE